MRILLAGVGRDGTNYDRSVAKPVPLGELAPVTTVTQRQLLEAKHGHDGHARVWGISTNGTVAKAAARELAPGDQVYFHSGQSVFAVAEVVVIIPGAHGIAGRLWPGWTDSFVFTVTPPVPANITKADVNALLDYHIDRWQGPRLLDESKSARLAGRVGLALLPEEAGR